LGGGLVKAQWFKHYREAERPGRFEQIVQSWDTANKVTELSDFSVCTTWGVRGKDLFLLNVLRKQLEFPALKRAVREQQSLFNADVVLIEDKASGTQLIQELMVDGCRGITRYKPEGDKIMRLHAQTATIENGFVHLPETAPWLAEYLHEMTVFPRGKHDDQVDSTAQFLDWLKTPISSWGIYETTRIKAEKLMHPEKDRERRRVLLQRTPGMAVQTLSGQHLIVAWDGTLDLSADDAEPFIRDGWVKLGEWKENVPPEGEQIAEQNKPKVTYAPGSSEWEVQQKQERLTRIAAEEEKEKRRCARVAAVMEKRTDGAAEVRR
jgi:predicted phage terminase large subunit-like protein